MTESGWNILEIALILIDTIVIVLFVLRQVYAAQTLNQFHEDEGRRFVSFAYNALIADNLVIAMALAIFFGMVKTLKLLRFNQKVGLLSLVLKTAAVDMWGMILAFLFAI